MTHPVSEPPTQCALPSVLASDRSTRADAFVRCHGFADIPEDALHAAAVFTIEYFERLRLASWVDFPVEAFAGVHLPGELYGFDALRASVVRALPFFFAWLARVGALSAAEAAALAKRAREVHLGAYRATTVGVSPGASELARMPEPAVSGCAGSQVVLAAAERVGTPERGRQEPVGGPERLRAPDHAGRRDSVVPRPGLPRGFS